MLNSLSSREKLPSISKVVKQRDKYEKDVVSTSQREGKSHGKKGVTEFFHKKVEDEEQQQEEGGKTTVLFGFFLRQFHVGQLASNSWSPCLSLPTVLGLQARTTVLS